MKSISKHYATPKMPPMMSLKLIILWMMPVLSPMSKNTLLGSRALPCAEFRNWLLTERMWQS